MFRSIQATAVVSLFLLGGAAEAQTLRRAKQPRAPQREAKSRTVRPRSAMVDPMDKVLPRIMFGGGWETTVVLMNIGDGSVDYTQDFFDVNGSLLPASVRMIPDGTVVTGDGMDGTLHSGATVSFTFYDDGGAARSGWSLLTYDDEAGRIAGYAIIRRRSGNGSVISETSAPLSNMADYFCYMPVDNTQGVNTILTLVNPSEDTDTHVELEFIGLGGDTLFKDTVKLVAGQQLSLSLPDAYSELAGRLATVYVSADIDQFSATGFRLTRATGALANVPISNWDVMFQ